MQQDTVVVGAAAEAVSGAGGGEGAAVRERPGNAAA